MRSRINEPDEWRRDRVAGDRLTLTLVNRLLCSFVGVRAKLCVDILQRRHPCEPMRVDETVCRRSWC